MRNPSKEWCLEAPCIRTPLRSLFRLPESRLWAESEERDIPMPFIGTATMTFPLFLILLLCGGHRNFRRCAQSLSLIP